MYDPNMPAPMPGQMQITGMGNPSQVMQQTQGQRVGVPGMGGFGGGMPPQFGGMSPGGFPAGMPQGGFGGMAPGGGFVRPQPQQGMGGGGFAPQMPGGMPGGYGGMIPPQMNALGGVQNMPNIGPRPMHGENRGGMGGHDVRAFIDAIRGWIGQRPEDMSGDARQGWMAQRPDFWTFMNQQQQQAATTPPMAAPTVI